MIVKLRNITTDIISIPEIGISLLPMQDETYDTITVPIQQSETIISHVLSGEVILNDLSKDFLPVDAVRYLLSGADVLPRGKDGKIAVHATSKYPGLYVYWTGRGDNFTNNYIGNGETILLQHKVGESKAQHKYIDFHCIDNKSEMREGVVVWENAKPGDCGSCSAVTSVMPTEPGVNTNFRLHEGYLIVPAAGDGDIQVTGDLTNIDPATGCFVGVVTGETGYTTPGFWNADYNPTTRKFENIAPAPDGTGKFNLFAVEVYISRFVNHLNFLGTGSVNLRSDDSAPLTHGMRLLHHINTSTLEGIPDHEWTFSVVLTLQRDRTY
jgi:hypothetical protein